MSFVVFPAGPSDAEDLARVHVTAWRESYRGLLPDGYLARMSEAAHARRFFRVLIRPGPQEIVLVAADRFGLVAYVGGGPARSGATGEAEISTLYVLREAQGQGLGARLFRSAARTLQSLGAERLMVSLLRDNFHARGFYEHLGGEPDPARQEPGPGGRLLYEVAYRWRDMGVLTG